MTRSILILLAVGSGCSITRTEEARIEGPRAEVSFLAGRSGKRPTGGYYLELRQHGREVAHHACDPDRPVVIPDLEPGRYDVVIRGEHLKSHAFEVRLKAGERTSIVVLHRNVLDRERAAEIATTAGEVFIYTVGSVVYGIVWLTVELVTHACDDDKDDRPAACASCHQSPCSCYRRDATPPAPTAPPARKEVRIRDWKKP